MTSVHEVLDGIFAPHAVKRLLILPGGHEITYAEFFGTAQNMAKRLRELGATPGTRVMIRLENSEHVLKLYIACALAGIVACPIDPLLPKQRVSTLESSLAPRFVADEGFLKSLLDAPASGDSTVGESSSDDDFLIVFSSGSTGEPKGIAHSLASMTASAASFSRLSEMNSATVVYHHFPMFYMAGIFNQFFCALLAGASVVIGPPFSKLQMLRFWDIPRAHDVNCLTLTPTMALSLCQLFRRDGHVLEHLSKYQSVIATGGPLHRSIAERFLASFKVPLRSCYGVTELGGTVTFQSWEDALVFQSVGGATGETEIKAGDESAPGEILVKTPFMAKGYVVKGSLVDFRDARGFFHTGDLGFLKDGLLFFTGRDHDLVKKGGEFVSTQLVEDLGLRNSLVTDVAAVGVPDEFWGAKLVLFYVPSQNVSEFDVLAEFETLFAGGLRNIERPDQIIPVPWMPKTSIGKIVKRDLVEKYTLSGAVGV